MFTTVHVFSSDDFSVSIKLSHCYFFNNESRVVMAATLTAVVSGDNSKRQLKYRTTVVTSL
jgi:hypothetical protein